MVGLMVMNPMVEGKKSPEKQVVSTHLKNILVKLEIFPKDRGETTT